jgi:hypothetical protein
MKQDADISAAVRAMDHVWERVVEIVLILVKVCASGTLVNYYIFYL